MSLFLSQPFIFFQGDRLILLKSILTFFNSTFSVSDIMDVIFSVKLKCY
jgi:hypothetical protein